MRISWNLRCIVNPEIPDQTAASITAAWAIVIAPRASWLSMYLTAMHAATSKIHPI